MVLTGLNEDGTFACIDECPECGQTNAKIIDSRLDDTLSLRVRRKECKLCGHRWNTVELTEEDFECMAGLAEARELLSLKQTAACLREQIRAMQNSIVKLTDVTTSLDGHINKAKPHAKQAANLYQANFKYSK